jgi:succinate dehydrogenase/fumarate reductase iron-sulfur protein
MKGEAKVLRYNPQKDKEPYYQIYQFVFEKGMTALDVLNQIYEEQDSTLGYSYCCRNGHCGMCGVSVNKKPVLLCKQAALPNMVIDPLQNISVVKDLIINREEYERKLPKLRLFLERQCKASHEPEHIDMKKFEKFKTASRCVECFSCISICPVYKNNPHTFKGPAAYALEARHFFDPRDEQNRSLLLKSEGIDLCSECGLCSKVCPHKVEPSGLIKTMKENP